MNTKFTLVLGGGGAKGAYQVGAVKALLETGIHFEAIIGTSVGALNGALIAQDELDKALDIWYNMSINNVINLPKSLKNGDKIKSEEIIEYIRDSITKHKGLDVSPLRNIIKDHLKPTKILKSGIEFGVITVNMSELSPKEVFLTQDNKERLVDFIIASSSFPGFSLPEIEGDTYIDGGFYDNVPFNVARGRGYRKIIVIDVSGPGISRRMDIKGCCTMYIRNSIRLGTVFSFNKNISKQFVKLGYLDTKRILGEYIGEQYFILPNNKYQKKFESAFTIENLAQTDRYLQRIFRKTNDEGILTKVRRYMPDFYKNWHRFMYPLLECAALSLNIDRINGYKTKQLAQTIIQKVDEIEEKQTEMRSEGIKRFFKNLKDKIAEESIPKVLGGMCPYEWDKAFRLFFGESDQDFYAKAFYKLLPILVPAKACISILRKLRE
ncbi:MAG: patatin-like phospholipase family protein [Spirochaetia bacterium]